MCGIYGAVAIENQFNPGIIQGLAWANRERGTDSLGYFDSSGRILKKAGDPGTLSATDDFRNWVANSAKNSWAIGGHTRYKTRGAVSDRNSHPFRYGKVIGSHNGMVDAPDRFAVDSEYLFYKISRGDYKSISDIGGYWGLAWFDKRDGLFYLTAHNNTLAYAYHEGAVYYSSDAKHLACFVSGEIAKMAEGQVLAFAADGTVYDSLDQNSGLESIEVTAKYAYGYSNRIGYNTSYTGTGCGTSDRKPVVFDPDDYSSYGTHYNTDLYPDSTEEADWRDAWERKIHDMSDEDFAWKG